MPFSVDVVVLGVAAVLAVVALVAAVVALRAVREVKALREGTGTASSAESPAPVTTMQEVAVHRAPVPAPAPEARIVEGRVIVPPTQEQVVAAQMTRPSVRVAIVVAGVLHALRPESRDRIGGLMRREYRQRRRARQRAARRAARVTPEPPPHQTDGWMSS